MANFSAFWDFLALSEKNWKLFVIHMSGLVKKKAGRPEIHQIRTCILSISRRMWACPIRPRVSSCVNCTYRLPLDQKSKIALTIKGQKIGASTKNFANKCLISIHLIVMNENIGLLGNSKTMPIPLLL